MHIIKTISDLKQFINERAIPSMEYDIEFSKGKNIAIINIKLPFIIKLLFGRMYKKTLNFQMNLLLSLGTKVEINISINWKKWYKII